MKITAKKTDKPPSSSDLDAWRRIAADDGLHRLRPEDIVAVIQRIGPKGDQRLLDALMIYISDEMLRLLRRRISTRHRNNGNDVIESAHDKLILAVLNPNSADGKGLREAFKARVNFRADDAIVAELRENKRYIAYETTEEGATVEPPDSAAPDYIEQVAYVEHLLSKIPDPRKCLAFRLHMAGCPITSDKGTESVARTLGVSDKTARAWISEVQALLKKEIGDSNDDA
jgi:hypothetical protein